VSGCLLVTGVITLVLFASGCSSSEGTDRAATTSTTTRAASDRIDGMRALVAVVGDSNVSLGGRALVRDLTRGTGGVLNADHLQGGYVPLFVGVPGAGIRTPRCPAPTKGCSANDFWAKKLGGTFARVNVDAVVTNLGINDASMPGTPMTIGHAAYDGKIDSFMEIVPSSVVVLWTNLPCAIEPSTVRVGCETINRALADAPARWRNLKIVDWESAAGNRASYIDQDGPPQYRVHYTEAGYAAWSQLVKGALDAEFPEQ
jgi:GDSL-like lipase/acylhydrolase family protein